MASLNEAKRNLLNASTFSMKRSVEDDVVTENFVICDDGRYKFYEKYYDEEFSTIDSLKSISVNESQINITQETNSQYIPFKMPRYWDGIDLMDMFIQVHWNNKNGRGDVSEVVNVRYSDNNITFGWLVNESVTSIAGEVQFEITAFGVNEKNENYKFRTKPDGKLTVLEALTYGGIVQPSNDWYVTFENLMVSYMTNAKWYADSAKASEENAELTYENMKADLENLTEEVRADVEPSIYANVRNNHYTKTESDAQLASLRTFCEDIDSLKQLKVDYDNTTGKLTFTDVESEEEQTVLSEVVIDSLANLKVKYEVVGGKGTLSFMNNET